MKKEKAVLELKKLSANDKVELGRTIVTSMDGNADFPSPIPALSEVDGAVDALDSAIQKAKDGGHTEVELMHAAEANLDNLLTQLAMYVEITANNDRAVILSAGMKAKHSKTPPHKPDAPANLTASATTNEGEAELNWEQTKRARVFVVELTDDPNVLQLGKGATSTTTATWKQVIILTKSKFTVTGLESGNKYAFRVYAVGAGGYSDYSDIVVTKVL